MPLPCAAKQLYLQCIFTFTDIVAALKAKVKPPEGKAKMGKLRLSRK